MGCSHRLEPILPGLLSFSKSHTIWIFFLQHECVPLMFYNIKYVASRNVWAVSNLDSSSGFGSFFRCCFYTTLQRVSINFLDKRFWSSPYRGLHCHWTTWRYSIWHISNGEDSLYSWRAHQYGLKTHTTKPTARVNFVTASRRTEGGTRKALLKSFPSTHWVYYRWKKSVCHCMVTFLQLSIQWDYKVLLTKVRQGIFYGKFKKRYQCD